MNRFVDSRTTEVQLDLLDDYATYQSKESALKIVYLNARSLKNKIDTLHEVLFCIRDTDVLAISETWINAHQALFYQLEGFNAMHNHRLLQEGGGVCFFVRKGITTELIDSCNEAGNILWISVRTVSYTHLTLPTNREV